MPAQVQERVLSHTGAELGDGMITLSTNQTAPQLATPIIAWEMPDMYEWAEYAATRHPTEAELRTEQTVTGTANDDTVVTVDADLQPVAGEEELADQEDIAFPAVIAADDAGNEIDITNIDYAANTVTLAQDPADTVDYHIYPLIVEGTARYRGVNQFNQVEGSLAEWGTPLYKFADYDQQKRGTEVNLQGTARWSTHERLEMVVDSPRAVTWTHAQFPRGQYVSKLNQRVDIKL